MTIQFWVDHWWWWLLAILVSFAVLEIASIVTLHMQGAANIWDWTLSDTIRRWSVSHRWLAPVSGGVTAFLWLHFFLETNPT